MPLTLRAEGLLRLPNGRGGDAPCGFTGVGWRVPPLEKWRDSDSWRERWSRLSAYHLWRSAFAWGQADRGAAGGDETSVANMPVAPGPGGLVRRSFV